MSGDRFEIDIEELARIAALHSAYAEKVASIFANTGWSRDMHIWGGPMLEPLRPIVTEHCGDGPVPPAIEPIQTAHNTWADILPKMIETSVCADAEAGQHISSADTAAGEDVEPQPGSRQDERR